MERSIRYFSIYKDIRVNIDFSHGFVHRLFVLFPSFGLLLFQNLAEEVIVHFFVIHSLWFSSFMRHLFLLLNSASVICVLI
jgi:hypothetical protein